MLDGVVHWVRRVKKKKPFFAGGVVSMRQHTTFVDLL